MKNENPLKNQNKEIALEYKIELKMNKNNNNNNNSFITIYYYY
jgi:hypothetical protein